MGFLPDSNFYLFSKHFDSLFMMMTLHPHAAQSPTIPMTVEAAVALLPHDAVVFSFRARYQPDAPRSIIVALPAPITPAECDGLWQHTCCEAFVSVPNAQDYLEFNFSPSGCWAAYRFDGYRLRDESFRCASAPQIEFTSHEQGFELTAVLGSALIRSLWPEQALWQIGLTAVIETTDGQKSYWALRHDDVQPDFHVRTQFLLDLQVSN